MSIINFDEDSTSVLNFDEDDEVGGLSPGNLYKNP